MLFLVRHVCVEWMVMLMDVGQINGMVLVAVHAGV